MEHSDYFCGIRTPPNASRPRQLSSSPSGWLLRYAVARALIVVVCILVDSLNSASGLIVFSLEGTGLSKGSIGSVLIVLTQ